MSQVLFFPIRHHSPVCAYHVQAEIRRHKPSVILIEGPQDANSLLPHLLEKDVRLPIALYAYRQSERPEQLYYPFCEYSPEWVAIQSGVEVGAVCSFIDLPSALMMDSDHHGVMKKEPLGESGYSKYNQVLARQSGYDSFEEFWEAQFEMAGFHQSAEVFFESMAWYGSAVRQLEEEDHAIDSQMKLREQWMAWQIKQVIQARPTETVAVLCGAAHHQTLQDLLVKPLAELEVEQEASHPSEITLIPYSFHRLSEQSGYGAGNRAPHFYQQVWKHGGNYARVSQVVLVEQLKHLRRQGFQVNLSHAIEAGKLASTLSLFRQKSVPGVKEIMDATVSCYGEGQAGRLEGVWRESLIGAAVGILPSNVAQTPLQREFYSEVQRRGIPLQDIPKPMNLSLTNATDQQISTFMHRLRVAGIPYGHLQVSKENAYQMLSAVRERWEVSWTPNTDVQLIEQSAFGSSLVEVCAFHLRQKLQQAKRIDEVTETLLEVSLTQLDHLWVEAFAQCENLSSEDRNFAALCQAVHHLSTLLKYGTTRRLTELSALERLLEKLYLRAVWTLLPATVVSEEGATEVMKTLQILYEVRSHAEGRTHFVHTLRKVMQKTDAHPMIAGFATSLLYLMEEVEDGEVERWLQGRLYTEPAEIVHLLQGLFRLNQSLFIRKIGLIGAIHTFVQSLEHETFIQLLPMLRSIFAKLPSMDQRYLTQTLTEVMQIEVQETRGLITAFTRRDDHQRLDAEMAAMVERWRVEYGL